MAETVGNYGKTFALLRAGCPSDWRDYTHHAFVEGLRTGELPKASFMHYLIQDYVFLVHFSRAWALGVVKAQSMEEMKVCSGTVDALVNHEMSLHVQTCAKEGIEEQTLFAADEDLENLAYTRYVLDAGLSGDFLDLMFALAPCCFGYGEIGLRLIKSAAENTPYETWIKTYADDEYQDVMAAVGKMLDDAVAARLGDDPTSSPRWAQLQERFTKATRLEVQFWHMGVRGDYKAA
jgi:thiaminase/transcriptional activator TenA